MASGTLTPARKKALLVLYDAKARGLTMRISNQTNEVCVYWQSADWLIQTGLAELVAYDHIEITDAGCDIAKAVA